MPKLSNAHHCAGAHHLRSALHSPRLLSNLITALAETSTTATASYRQRQRMTTLQLIRATGWCAQVAANAILASCTVTPTSGLLGSRCLHLMRLVITQTDGPALISQSPLMCLCCCSVYSTSSRLLLLQFCVGYQRCHKDHKEFIFTADS